IDNEGKNSTGKFYCAFCNKLYAHKGACQNHVFNEHYGAIKVDAERIDKEWSKKVEEMTKRSAVDYGTRYFEYLESSIKDLLREVQRYHKNFDDAIAEKKYLGTGEKRKQRQAVDEIGYCVHHVGRTFQGYEHEATIAIRSLVSAFKFGF
ncbi:MAG: hypothetical protein KAQ85_10265, partial [Thermodesulfovibrionia bacterium]|nr:hypothetical protein [Thermodesulfovibrionia bacterium]